jgi:PAS domain S-box-containing protein
MNYFLLIKPFIYGRVEDFLMVNKPVYEELEQTLKQLKDGDHLCCIYETEEEHRALLAPFVAQGLELNEKVFYIVDDRTVEDILESLRDQGVTADAYHEKGQLTILSADEAYMRDGTFDPDSMIALVEDETKRALSEGYSGLRATGEMSWALKGSPGSERLIEYEAKFNDFLAGSKCKALCQYDRRRFGPAILPNVLTTHPIVIIGTEVFDNLYYMPPHDFLGPHPEEARLSNRLKTLADRKRGEGALRESEKKYRELVENANSIILRMDAEGNVTFFNEFAQEFFGFAEDEIIGKNVIGTIVPETESTGRDLVDLIKDIARNPHRYYNHENENMTKNGERAWVSWTNKPVYNEQGRVMETLCIGNDITKRKQAEAALRKSEEKYRGLFENSKDMIFFTTRDGKYIDLNQAGLDLFGLTKEELPEINVVQTYVNSNDRIKILQEIDKKKYVKDYPLRLRKRDGTQMECLTTATVWLDANGNNAGYWGITRDITELKRAEYALMEREKTLEAKTRSLEETNTALKVLLERREKDKSNLGNTVLNNMKELVYPFLTKLHHSSLNATQKAYLEVVETNLKQVVSPFSQSLSVKYADLTPTEIRVANLVKDGKSTKEIADLLGSSKRTVDFHRRRLREKLAIRNEKVNLRAYLLSRPK